MEARGSQVGSGLQETSQDNVAFQRCVYLDAQRWTALA